MFCMADDAEWKLILALEILAAELRHKGMSKNRIREILNLRFRGDQLAQDMRVIEPGGSAPRRRPPSSRPATGTGYLGRAISPSD